MKNRWHRWTEAAQRAIAWRVPAGIAYWVAIRVIVHATQGPYADQNVPDLRAMDALSRWRPPVTAN